MGSRGETRDDACEGHEAYAYVIGQWKHAGPGLDAERVAIFDIPIVDLQGYQSSENIVFPCQIAKVMPMAWDDGGR